MHAVLNFKPEPGVTYFVQVGATRGGGNLQFQSTCDDCSVPANGGQVVGPSDGAGVGIAGPNTGSGGYLPGARR